jgi:HSP20 family protein
LAAAVSLKSAFDDIGGEVVSKDKDKQKNNKSLSVSPWQSLSDWRQWERQIERVFDDLFERRMSPFRGAARSGRGDVPAVDVYEQDKELVAKVELPGLEKDDIDVTLTDQTLTIKAEKKKAEEIKDENYHRLERVHGLLRRSIDLPAGVDVEQVKASFRNGVLEIRMPRSQSEASSVNRIPVE